MDIVPESDGSEPDRWTIVFHRTAANRWFSMIAMGEFKHVSAFAWLPDQRVWLMYDVGFRRTRIVVLPDNVSSKARLSRLIEGHAIVTMPVCPGALPIFRFSFFCTTAIKHLIGLRSSALRPDRLFRDCLRHGGVLSDDAKSTRAKGRSRVRGAEDCGPELANQRVADPGCG